VAALSLPTIQGQPARTVAGRYAVFMKKVGALAAEKDLEAFIKTDTKNSYGNALSYYNSARGASTDLTPRQERYAVLKRELLGQ
jgi:hypothetical protein